MNPGLIWGPTLSSRADGESIKMMQMMFSGQASVGNKLLSGHAVSHPAPVVILVNCLVEALRRGLCFLSGLCRVLGLGLGLMLKGLCL
jgi:hypothetical protein